MIEKKMLSKSKEDKPAQQDTDDDSPNGVVRFTSKQKKLRHVQERFHPTACRCPKMKQENRRFLTSGPIKRSTTTMPTNKQTNKQKALFFTQEVRIYHLYLRYRFEFCYGCYKQRKVFPDATEWDCATSGSVAAAAAVTATRPRDARFCSPSPAMTLSSQDSSSSSSPAGSGAAAYVFGGMANLMVSGSSSVMRTQAMKMGRIAFMNIQM